MSFELKLKSFEFVRLERKTQAERQNKMDVAEVQTCIVCWNSMSSREAKTWPRYLWRRDQKEPKRMCWGESVDKKSWVLY